jgi:plasmid stabilization system protein ParE
MMRARFVESARQELLSQIAYYAAINPRTGRQFRQAVESAVIRATAFPNAGTPSRQQTRRVFVRRFPFAIVYRVEGDEIAIYAVAHHAREPDYWSVRLDH